MGDVDRTPRKREVVVPNKEGLHFRPIMQFVDLAMSYSSKVSLCFDGRVADARSPMELLMLVATCGAKLEITAEGEDADQALEALYKLVESGFGET
jgi:phosphotransferase system HPr (HPr) family protein